MNSSEYIATFSNFLQTGHLQRQEIIDELKTHLDELPNGARDIDTQLGNPKLLAQKYDRVHLGIFHTPRRIYWTIFSALAFYYLNQILNVITGAYGPLRLSPQPPDAINAWQYLANSFSNSLIFILPLVVVIVVGRVIAKMNEPWRIFKKGVVLAFAGILAINVVNYIFERISFDPLTLPGNLMFSVMFTIFLAIMAILVMIVSTPIAITTKKMIHTRFSLEIIIFLSLLLLAIPFTMILTETFLVPFDLVREEARLAMGTFARTVNDFFEGGLGAYLPTVIAELALFYAFVKRFRTYQKYENQEPVHWCLSFTFGLIVAFADLDMNTVYFPALLLVVLAIILGAMAPRKVWRWAIMMGLWPFVFRLLKPMLTPSNDAYYLSASLLYIVPAFLGTYLGVFFRQLIGWFQEKKLTTQNS